VGAGEIISASIAEGAGGIILASLSVGVLGSSSDSSLARPIRSSPTQLPSCFFPTPCVGRFGCGCIMLLSGDAGGTGIQSSAGDCDGETT